MFNIAIRRLVGSGLLISQGGKRITGPEEEFYNFQLIKWMADLLKSMWMFGFAVCVAQPHDLYGGVPIVLDMSMLRIKVAVDITGARHYKIRARMPERSKYPNLIRFGLARAHSYVGVDRFRGVRWFRGSGGQRR